MGIFWERVVAVMFALSHGGDMGSVTDIVREVLFSGKYVGVVLANLPAMTVWTAVIVGLSLLSMFTLMVGLVVMPLLGHATWCAYRDVVE